MKIITISKKSTIFREFKVMQYFMAGSGTAGPAASPQSLDEVLAVGNMANNKPINFNKNGLQRGIFLNDQGELVVQNLRLMDILDFYVDNETVFFVDGKLTTAPGGKIFDETFDITFE
jgi:hypothetical protein